MNERSDPAVPDRPLADPAGSPPQPPAAATLNVADAIEIAQTCTLAGRADLLTRHDDKTKIVVMKTDYTRSIPPEWGPMSRIFVALGDAHRQRILMLFDQGERLNVGQIAAVSTLTRSTVSHHLKILREAEVLCSEKIGKEVWFWINKRCLTDTFDRVLDYVRTYC